MASLRLITWNCRSGSLNSALAHLAPLNPDVVFVQECAPAATLPIHNGFLLREVNQRKAVALGSLRRDLVFTPLPIKPDASRGTLAGTIGGAVEFNVLGIWAQASNYIGDVLRTIDSYRDELRSKPSVVMGDLNSGTYLSSPRKVTSAHRSIVDALEDLGLVSAYHEHMRVAHGDEQHATYCHLFRPSEPWHIDFCFIPRAWSGGLRRVSALSDPEWGQRSDHRPLVVEVEFATLR